MRLNQAKWCRTHKRPLIHERDDKWWLVVCPGHFRVSFPLIEGMPYKWTLERFGWGARTHILYGR